MSVDTSGLFDWPSPDAVESAAPVIGAGGRAYLSSVEMAAATWVQLNAHYGGDGAEEIQDVFGTVMPHAGLLAQTAEQATGVLIDFAEGIRALVAERDALMLQVHAANRALLELPDGPEAKAGSPLPSTELLLRAAADSAAVLARNYTLLEETTAGRLTGIVLGEGRLTNQITDLSGTVVTGAVSRLSVLPSSRQTVVKIPTPSPVYVPYDLEAERLRYLARGRWVTDGRWVLISVNQLELRPRVSRVLYRHSHRYRNEVDNNRAKWAPALKGRDLTKTAAAFRAGGAALSVATAGFTIADERQDAYNELLQAHPEMHPDDMNGRAEAAGLVKGGTKIGIDVLAAANGALIGSAIGGPAGTVAGAAVGIGISVVTSLELGFLGNRTLKDAAADTALELADSFMESDLMKSGAGTAARGAVDAVADCWNKLFGR